MGSPSRIRKLIAAQSDPLLAHEIYTLSSFSSSKSLPSLILKLARSHNFSHAFSLLRRLPSPLPPSLISSLSLTFSSLSRPDLSISLLNLFPSSLYPLHSSPKHLSRTLLSLSSHPSSLPSALSLLRSHPDPSSLSPRPFNILISALARSRRLSLAFSLFNSMPVPPDSESYRLLAQALCRRSQLNTALHLLDDMLNKGLTPDSLTYTTLLNSLCRKTNLREAYKLLTRMKVRGCNPDIVHFNTVVVGFCKAGHPLDACKVLDDMPEHGCSPNQTTYAALIGGLSTRGIHEVAERYLAEMVGKGMKPHFSAFHGVVKGYCGLGKAEEAGRVVEMMLGVGVVPHMETWVVVVSGVCEDDREKLDEDFRKVASKEKPRDSVVVGRSGWGWEYARGNMENMKLFS